MKTRMLATILLVLLLPFCAFAQGETPVTAVNQSVEPTPVLTSISFKNATVNEPFSGLVKEYTLTLDNPTVSPTLEDYEVEGDARIFINYILDATNHQQGIAATLEYESGTTIYNFYYTNAQTYAVSDNCYLLEVQAQNTEVYPKINRKNRKYKLYIPADMTVLNLTAATEEVSAYCNVPSEIIIGAKQEPVITLTVTASGGDTRNYTFEVKRLELTTEEVSRRMAQEDFTTLAEQELVFRNPVFYIIAGSVLCGTVLIALLVSLFKRLTVRAQDSDEEPFFEEQTAE